VLSDPSQKVDDKLAADLVDVYEQRTRAAEEGKAKTELARLMTYKAAWLYDEGRPFAKEAAMAKLHASEVAMRVADAALQVHGGYGYVHEYPIGRFFCDAKILEIGEGTNEIQRLVIARELGC